MGIALLKAIALGNIFIFLLLNLFSRLEKGRLYVYYILCSFPFLNISLFAHLNGFVFISYAYLFFFYKHEWTEFPLGRFYRILFILMMAFLVMGIFFSEFPFSLESITGLAEVIPVFIFSKSVIDLCSRTPDSFFRIPGFIRGIVLFCFVFLLLQMVLGAEFNLNGAVRPHVLLKDGVRYTSILSDPQHLSQFLALLSFLCLIDTYEEKGAWTLLFRLFLIGTCVFGILNSGGRSGLMGFVLGLFLIFLFIKPKYQFSLILLLLLAFLAILNFKDNFSIFKRGPDLNETYDFRYSIWLEAIQMFKDNPVFGVGIGNYANHVFYHNPNQFWELDHQLVPFDVPENGYLKILTEYGLPAFVALFAMILIPIGRGFFYFLRTRDFNTLFLCASAIGFFVSFNGTYTFADVRIVILYTTIISLLMISENVADQVVLEED